MFGKKSKKPDPAIEQTDAIHHSTAAQNLEDNSSSHGELGNMQNIIGKGTVIEGNIIAEGDLIVEGTVRGDVTTKTSLVVSPSCTIEGNILAQHAEVAGRVKGTVKALGLLVIKSSSTIDGDVLTKNLNVESGSTFNGRFTVGSVTSTEQKTTKKSETSAISNEAGVLASDLRRAMPNLAAPMVKAM